VYDEYADKEKHPLVLFVGAEIGGVFAKLIGMLTERPGIGFLSFPAADDQIFYQFEFNDQDTPFVTNIFNIGGKFGLQENEAGANFALPVMYEHKFAVDNIYRSLCTFADLCGRTAHFQQYCDAAIGPGEFKKLQDYLLQ
jgi:hypothetical protein